MKNNDNHLRLFVYGTLKKGFWNFDQFCTRAISIEPATTWGRLYQLPAGFPALEVPESCILATGTADPLADTRTQNTIELPENGMTRPEGDWDLVHGELPSPIPASICRPSTGWRHSIRMVAVFISGFWWRWRRAT